MIELHCIALMPLNAIGATINAATVANVKPAANHKDLRSSA